MPAGTREKFPAGRISKISDKGISYKRGHGDEAPDQRFLAVKFQHRVNDTHLIVFVGGVVLEEYDALAVQAPIVPLSLQVLEKVWNEGTVTKA